MKLKSSLIASLMLFALPVVNFLAYAENNAPSVSYVPQMFHFDQYGTQMPNAITADANNNIWIASGDQEGKTNCNVIEIPFTNQNKPIVYNSGAVIKFDNDLGIVADSNGNIWVSLLSGVLELPATQRNIPIMYEYINTLGHGFSGITVDPTGNIWAAHSQEIPTGQPDGVMEIPVQNRHWDNLIDYTASNYQFSVPYAVTSDPTGNIWVANSQGNSVTEIPVTKPGEPPAQPVIYAGGWTYQFAFPNAIASDAKGNIWVGNGNSGNLIEIPVNSPDWPKVYYSGLNCDLCQMGVAVDPSGNIWMAVGNPSGGPGGNVVEFPVDNLNSPKVYSGSEYQFSNPVSIASDKLGNIWVANNSGNSVTELVKQNQS